MTKDDLLKGLAVLLALAVLLVSAALAFAVGPVVSACSLAWTAPTTNTDGTPLTDLARYEVQVGPAPGVYPTPPVSVGAVTPAPAPGTTVTHTCAAADGQRYARVRACDLAGNCSTWSDEVPFVLDAVAPSAPVNLRVGG